MKITLRPMVGLLALTGTLALASLGCGKGPDVGGCGGTTPANTDGTTASSHYLFPLSGSHSGLDCNTCHGGAPDWPTINCICCHAHSQASTDSLHAADGGVPGYQYASQKCFQCHTAG